jgi:hypothetical protein
VAYAPPAPWKYARHQQDAWAEVRHLAVALKGQVDLPLLLVGEPQRSHWCGQTNQPLIPQLGCRRSIDRGGPAGRKEEFMDFCDDLSLHILNGCISPDFDAGGRPTHLHILSNNRTSTTVIVCALAITDLLDSIDSFSVADFIEDTDHATTTVDISLPYATLSDNQQTSLSFQKPRPHYPSSSPLECKIRQVLQQKDTQQTYA